MQDLTDIISDANKAYRLGNPVMTDAKYDSLIEELRETMLEEEFSAFMRSLNEGAVEDQKNKVKHPFVLGSLNKLKYEEPKTVLKFINQKVKGTLSVSAKIDGISCRLHYEDGILTQASTRGDGTFGQDLTNKIKYVKYIPESLVKNGGCKGGIDIRGELVILKSDFEKMTGFANPRNACAGIMNRKDFSPVEIANVSFVAYTILGDAYTKEEQFDILERNGFKVAWHTEITPQTVEERDFELVEDLFMMARQDFEYDTDGLVMCNIDYRNEAKYYPDGCAAFKINQLGATTKIVDVEFQGPSKNGKMIPVAILEPVPLGGAIVTKATLHNNDFIRETGVAYGSVVETVKAGDIIPKIVRVVSNENTTPIAFPETCPCCGTRLVEKDHLMTCPNKACKDQTTYQVQHFLEKLEIENVSFKRLQQMGIYTIDDLVKFKPDGNYKIETKLYSDLKEKMFGVSRRRLFSALDMENISVKTLDKIFDFYGFENAILHENLSGLPMGVGDITMGKFLERVDENAKTVEMIVSDSRYSYVEGNEAKMKAPATIGSICFTGSLETMGRKEASILAEKNGFEVKNSVTKGLTYLVMADPNSNSTKAKKARESGTTIIGEAEFIKMMNSNGMNVDDL